MEIRQTQKQTQKLALTFQMKQSLHILQLPLLELKDYIGSELENNPVLESQPTEDSYDALPAEKIQALEELPNESFFSQDFDSGIPQRELNQKRDYQQSLVTKSITLQESLLQQLRTFSEKEINHTFARYIISHIDDNGYLHTPLETLTQQLCTAEVTALDAADHTDVLEELKQTLSQIQEFDPSGVGACNLKECLLIQLRRRKKRSSLTFKIVDNFLPLVAKHDTKGIAKKLKIHVDSVKKAFDEIAKLEPKPGRSFTPMAHMSLHMRTPDIVVEKQDDTFEIIINQYGLPRLHINALYRKLLRSNDADAETKAFIKEKIANAMGLLRAIMQREKTLRVIMESIIEAQKDFFLHGDNALLKPLTLKDIAQRTQRDQSTISRVVNNKYVKTPYGIFKLNYFFVKSLKSQNQDEISTESIKSLIYDLIQEEDKQMPLKDHAIVERLRAQGITIARRTVVKYREAYGIPPAHRRKQSTSSS